MIKHMRPRYFALAAAALLAGCGADSSVSPSTPVSLDEVFSEMTLPALSAASSLSPRFGGPITLGSPVPAGCSYATASASFICAPITQGAFTITQSYQLLNGSGSPLSAFEPTSLAAVRMQGTITGTETDALGTLTLDGREDQTLSGLQTNRHVLNGTATMNMSGTYMSGTVSTPITSTMTTTISDLVIPANPGPNTYPASGTITIDETSVVPGIPLSPTRIVVTFNGTSKVKVTVDGVSIPGCSTIDLSSTTLGCS
jgi:hypothetical protein